MSEIYYLYIIFIISYIIFTYKIYDNFSLFKKEDKIYGVLIISLIFLNIKYPKIILYLHILFSYILVSLPLISKNNILLKIYFILLLLFVYSQLIYKGCILTELQTNNKKITMLQKKYFNIGIIIIIYTIILCLLKINKLKIPKIVKKFNLIFFIIITIFFFHEYLVISKIINKKSILLTKQILSF